MVGHINIMNFTDNNHIWIINIYTPIGSYIEIF